MNSQTEIQSVFISRLLRAEVCHDTICTYVDLAHLGNLMVLLDIIGLVDAYLIDPEGLWLDVRAVS